MDALDLVKFTAEHAGGIISCTPVDKAEGFFKRLLDAEQVIPKYHKGKLVGFLAYYRTCAPQSEFQHVPDWTLPEQYTYGPSLFIDLVVIHPQYRKQRILETLVSRLYKLKPPVHAAFWLEQDGIWHAHERAENMQSNCGILAFDKITGMLNGRANVISLSTLARIAQDNEFLLFPMKVAKQDLVRLAYPFVLHNDFHFETITNPFELGMFELPEFSYVLSQSDSIGELVDDEEARHVRGSKKFFKDIMMPILGGIAGTIVAPGIGTVIGSGLGSMGGQLLEGKSFGSSALSGLEAGGMSALGGSLLGATGLGSALGSLGTNAGNALGGAVGDATLGSDIGGFLNSGGLMGNMFGGAGANAGAAMGSEAALGGTEGGLGSMGMGGGSGLGLGGVGSTFGASTPGLGLEAASPLGSGLSISGAAAASGGSLGGTGAPASFGTGAGSSAVGSPQGFSTGLGMGGGPQSMSALSNAYANDAGLAASTPSASTTPATSTNLTGGGNVNPSPMGGGGFYQPLNSGNTNMYQAGNTNLPTATATNNPAQNTGFNPTSMLKNPMNLLGAGLMGAGMLGVNNVANPTMPTPQSLGFGDMNSQIANGVTGAGQQLNTMLPSMVSAGPAGTANALSQPYMQSIMNAAQLPNAIASQQYQQQLNATGGGPFSSTSNQAMGQFNQNQANQMSAQLQQAALAQQNLGTQTYYGQLLPLASQGNQQAMQQLMQMYGDQATAQMAVQQYNANKAMSPFQTMSNAGGTMLGNSLNPLTMLMMNKLGV